MRTDGLTIAKHDYPIVYTMDNMEVNKGLSDMVWLCAMNVVGENETTWQALYDSSTRSIEKELWDLKSENYFTYVGGMTTDWRTFYPDATCQLYSILNGVIPQSSGRANQLWQHFNDYYPAWDLGTIYDPGGFPWAVLGYVAVIIGDKNKAANYISHVKSFTDNGIQPTSNWYNAEAAFVILAANNIKL
jgi:hypothetical protein